MAQYRQAEKFCNAHGGTQTTRLRFGTSRPRAVFIRNRYRPRRIARIDLIPDGSARRAGPGCGQRCKFDSTDGYARGDPQLRDDGGQNLLAHRWMASSRETGIDLISISWLTLGADPRYRPSLQRV
jgi:hypothetical protein